MKNIKYYLVIKIFLFNFSFEYMNLQKFVFGVSIMEICKLNFFLKSIQIFCVHILLSQSIYSAGAPAYVISELDNPYPGYINFDDGLTPSFSPVDNYGYHVKEIIPEPGDIYFFKLKNGNISQFAGNHYYIYNNEMQLIDSIPNPTQYSIDFHDFISLSNGRYLMLVNEERMVDMSTLIEGGDPHAIITNNILVETDRTGAIYWQWSSLDYLNILDATSDINLKGQHIDYAHINSMFEDANGNILISIRHFDEIALIDKSNKNFIWRMGGTKCVNNQFSFVNDVKSNFKGFSHQHTPQILDNGNILVFDNGNMRSNPSSRVVEYSVDYANKVVTKVWEYENNPPTYNFSMGSAYRLPNGNTLICWSQDKINEIKPDKSIAFEMILNEFNYIYRAQKFSTGIKFAFHLISNSGDFAFNGNNGNTGVTLSVSSISSSTTAYIQKHNYAPHTSTFSDSSFSSILPLRWVLSTEKSSANISGTIKIKVSELNTNLNPSKLAIYKRSKEAEGNFDVLQTTYNTITNELTAPFSGWGEFVVVSAILEAPELSTPINNAYLSDDGKLTWQNVSGASYYRVQLSKSQNFSNNVISQTISDGSSYNFSNLSFNSVYYWRVKAYNDLDSSAWSVVGFFNTNIAPPVLALPRSNSFGFSKSDTLRWNIVEGADKYQIQINGGDNFVISHINVKGLTNNYFKTQYLDYNTQYFWRVRAFKGVDSSKWSTIFNFTSEIANPILLSPLDSAINVELSQQFTWSLVPGAESYILEVSDNINFIKPIIKLNKLQVNQIELSDLAFANTYYWRVKAFRPTDSSEWSPILNFSTQLPQVKLQSPKNNEKNVRVDSRVSWVSQTTEVEYNVQISLDEYFSKIAIDTIGVNNNYLQLIELKAYTDYYWRVKSVKGEFISGWSEVYHFKTNVGLELQSPKLLLPANFADDYADLNFVWIKRAKAVKYKIQVALDKEFSKVVLNEITAKTSHYLENLEVDNNYYWRIKAFSIYDSSTWSEVWTVRIIDGSKHVELLSPGNDELQIPTSGLLQWEDIPEIDYYSVQLDFHEEFSSPLLFEDVGMNSFAYSQLVYNHTYFWRVRYVKGEVISDWSIPWSFTTATSIVLDTPKVTSHSNKMVAVPVNGSVSWENVQSATDYQVSFSDRDNFSTIFYKQSSIKGLSIAYTELDYGYVYFLRVSAYNDSSKSAWSHPIEFLTELEMPIVEYPKNGEENVPSFGAITWSIKNEFDLYSIQVALDSSFTNIVSELDNFDYTFYNYMLEDNTQYFCRVRTYNDTNYSKWSKIVKFTTQNPSSFKIETIAESDLKVFPNPASDWINYSISSEINNVNITICDLNGKEVIKLKRQMKEGRINITRLTQGVYFLKTSSDSKIFIKK